MTSTVIIVAHALTPDNIRIANCFISLILKYPETELKLLATLCLILYLLKKKIFKWLHSNHIATGSNVIMVSINTKSNSPCALTLSEDVQVIFNNVAI